MTDIEIINNLIQGNGNAAIAFMCQTYWQETKAHILKNSGTETEAEDFFQEMLVKVWQSVKDGGFKAEQVGSFRGFFFTIIRRRWIDVLRKKGRAAINSLDDTYAPILRDDTFEDLEQKIEADERLQSLLDKLASLGEMCKKMLQFFYLDDLSIRQIAEIEKAEEGTIKTRLSRCRNQMRN